MKKIYCLVVIMALVSFVSCVHAAAADEKAAVKKPEGSVATPAAAAAGDIKMSKEEIIKHLNDILIGRADIAINDLQVVKGEAGPAVMYKGKKLEDYDKETLSVLMRQVNQQVS